MTSKQLAEIESQINKHLESIGQYLVTMARFKKVYLNDEAEQNALRLGMNSKEYQERYMQLANEKFGDDFEKLVATDELVDPEQFTKYEKSLD